VNLRAVSRIVASALVMRHRLIPVIQQPVLAALDGNLIE
jgi:hypothetical protein